MSGEDLRARLLDLSQPAPALTEPGRRYRLRDARGFYLVGLASAPSWTRVKKRAATYGGGPHLDSVIYEHGFNYEEVN